MDRAEREREREKEREGLERMEVLFLLDSILTLEVYSVWCHELKKLMKYTGNETKLLPSCYSCVEGWKPWLELRD